MTTFDQAFAITVGHEGGFDDTVSDRGNWTGGYVGSGTLKGTKYGISAESYPMLDIANLTLADAETIYRRDYWAKIAGDDLPPSFAVLAFDSAVNNGVGAAQRWMQIAAGVTVDCVIGPITLAAIRAADPTALAVEFQAQRMNFMARIPEWRTDGLGFARRLAALPYQSLKVTGES